MHYNIDELDKAESLLNKLVKTAEGKVGRLIAIYDDWFETTAGFTKEIDDQVASSACTFDGQHATYLPIDFHYNLWVFDDGYKGLIDHIEFTADVAPGREIMNIYDDNGKAHKFVTEAK